MTLFLIRRFVQGAVMSLIVFVAIDAVGNPVDILINPDATPPIKQIAPGRHAACHLNEAA